MRTTWQEDGATKEVVAPLSLIVSAFAPSEDARRALTPQLRTDAGETELVLVDLGARPEPPRRLAARAGVTGSSATHVPDLDDPAVLKAFFAAIQSLNREGLLLAYHDRSDGGLFACACEMAFAGHCGVTLNLDLLGYDPAAHDVDGNERRPELMQGRDLDRVLAGLFAEELGARGPDPGRRPRGGDAAAGATPACTRTAVGAPNARDEIRLVRNAKPVLDREGASTCSAPGPR